MKAIVYYRHLSAAQTAHVNREGWSSEVGTAYLAAREGRYADAIRLGLMEPAARLDRPDAEAVWRDLQNVDSSWTAKADIERLTDFPRSMDVGDVIVWENRKIERCADIGFGDAGDFRPPGKATVGTIIHGTGRSEDLLEAFADEAERLWVAPALVGQARAMIASRAEIDEAGDVEDEGVEDQRCELVTKLHDALDGAAPPYCYFGHTGGDLSDYGFWPSMEQIQELPVVECGDDAKALGEDAAFVNDHGNVTVFGGDGSVLLEIV